MNLQISARAESTPIPIIQVNHEVYEAVKALYLIAKEINNDSFIPEIVIPREAYNKLAEVLPDLNRLICLWKGYTMVALLDYEQRYISLN